MAVPSTELEAWVQHSRRTAELLRALEQPVYAAATMRWPDLRAVLREYEALEATLFPQMQRR
jgi:hypothetical protein